MSTEYTIVIEKDEDGYYVGSIPGLPGCHTQGKSIDQLLERMEEAILCNTATAARWTLHRSKMSTTLRRIIDTTSCRSILCSYIRK